MLEMAPVRRLLIVDPCDACHSLLPELGSQGWAVETCTLGGASDIPCDVGILRLRPFHLEWPAVIESLIMGTTAQWIAIIDQEVLRLASAAELLCSLFAEFLVLPLVASRLLGCLERVRGEVAHLGDGPELLGESRPIRELRRLLGKLAISESSVLITGASGSGHEAVARSLHRQSNRREQPFVVFNCAPMSAEVLHRELFGVEKGTLFSSPEGRVGRLEEANGGTLFLDCIDRLPLETQARLLVCLQEKRFQRMGGQQPLGVDVRVLAASSADLPGAVSDGLFRDDLYYRLNVLQVETTALNERHGDLALLAQHFSRFYGQEAGRRARGFSEGALVAMARHGWPGNIRELGNRVHLAILVAEGRQIDAADLGLQGLEADGLEMATLEEYKHRAERQALCDVLTRHSDNFSAAAKVLGVSRPTFYRLLHKHQMR